jgi:hypothetical protein
MELVWCRDGGGKGWMTLVASPECRLMVCEIGGFDDWGMVVAGAWSGRWRRPVSGRPL